MEPKLEHEDSERQDLVVLGRKIGTFTGWDQLDTVHLLFTGFEPLDALKLPKGDISINYDAGTFEITDGDKAEEPEPRDGEEEGGYLEIAVTANVVATGDIVYLVCDLPRDDGSEPLLTMVKG
jgi:hypothetical protein